MWKNAPGILHCADALHNGELTPPPFPGAVFVELMQTATSSVEFSFNNIMHRQIDGVAMGSSLANIFVGYYEALLFKRINKPLINTSMIPLLFLTTKTNVMSFSPI